MRLTGFIMELVLRGLERLEKRLEEVGVMAEGVFGDNRGGYTILLRF